MHAGGTTRRRKASWTMAIAVAALAWSGFVAAGAADDHSLNTGMADPKALFGAY